MNAFEQQVSAVDPQCLQAATVEVLQVNLGLRCNMACTHCHQRCSPTRQEMMSDAVIEAMCGAARRLQPSLVDITGGAPELHPRVREIVIALRRDGHAVQLRTNLTVLLEPGCEDLPERWAELGVGLLGSFPSWDPEVTARQRGERAFAASIEALRRLNGVGYGTTSALRLDLSSNPDGARLPPPTAVFEQRLRGVLREQHGVHFHHLRVLTNMALGRFGEQLRAAGGQRSYHDALRAAFNGAAVPRLACRTSLVVAWDGVLYDCDFNLGAALPLHGARLTIFDLPDDIASRRIAFGPHCFACTAAAGSS